jgi:hypothetical protein
MNDDVSTITISLTIIEFNVTIPYIIYYYCIQSGNGETVPQVPNFYLLRVFIAV